MNKKNLEKKIWNLAKLRAIEKWGIGCQCCGDSANDVHHFISRTRCLGLKYSVNNLLPLCRKCHSLIHFGDHSAIDGQIVFRLGKRWFDQLIKQREFYKKYPVKNNIIWLQEQLSKVGGFDES